jgi:predicted nuclease of predicted toxin-antitoxin system
MSMPLAFLLDENLPGRLVKALKRHNAEGIDVVDIVRVGEPEDLPLGTDDQSILVWVERENRILITRDKTTVPTHLADYHSTGGSSPGVFILRPGYGVPDILEFLILVAHATDAYEWKDRIEFIP